jgi:hypothetical protein
MPYHITLGVLQNVAAMTYGYIITIGPGPDGTLPIGILGRNCEYCRTFHILNLIVYRRNGCIFFFPSLLLDFRAEKPAQSIYMMLGSLAGGGLLSRLLRTSLPRIFHNLRETDASRRFCPGEFESSRYL